jgi:hypothetical protein
MEADKIKEIINTAAEGVEKSKFGPFITNTIGENQTLVKNVNPVCFQIFMVVLAETISASLKDDKPTNSLN